MQLYTSIFIINGKKNLYIHANSANDMRDAIDFADKYYITNIIIIGGEDALNISNILVLFYFIIVEYI